MLKFHTSGAAYNIVSDQTKTCAKKFSDDEVMSIVDIIEENKSKILEP